jgi:acetyl esterase/lipase
MKPDRLHRHRPRRRLLGILALAWLVPAAGTALADGPPVVPAEVRYYPDLTYRKVGNRELRLDLAHPQAGAGPYPAVVIIHGTGLLTAGRKGQVHLALELARAGYAAAAVSYRYSPADTFPAAVEDLRTAIRWLHGNAAKYRIDPNRVGAVGFSGGGSLACLLGMAPTEADAKKGPSVRLRAVVSYGAPADLARLHAGALLSLQSGTWPGWVRGLYLRSALEKWLGGAPGQVPERYAQASPVTHVRKGVPPVLLIHGTADAIIPAEQSRLLARKVQAAGGRVRLLLLEQAPHDLDELHDDNARRAAEAVRTFLAENLK